MLMQVTDKIFQIKGCVQHYDWGGTTFIPHLLNIDNINKKPFAEYWMGAHTVAPSMVVLDNSLVSISDLIQQNPTAFLGNEVYSSFGDLPFLFKILDVKEMLSIQVHPSKKEAEKGFEKENEKGIALNAYNRNYKDKNHKPEVMIALSDFWLLHGFLTKEKLQCVLENEPAWQLLLPILQQKGIEGLYQYVMELTDAENKNLLVPVIEKALAEQSPSKLSPAYWVQKLFKNKNIDTLSSFDRGIFSIYFFNIMQVAKGEAVFQAAGVPHAYLEGQNVELMANSDNVLRGGLTTKYIDVPELLKHTSFEGIIPQKLQPTVHGFERIFTCPVPDFNIAEISLPEKKSIKNSTHSLNFFIVCEGSCQVQAGNAILQLKHGDAFIILPDTDYIITTDSQKALIYRAFVV